MGDKTILLVEDDKEAVEMYRMFFENADFEVVGICANGRDAVVYINDKKPRVVLLDIGLKGDLNGMDVLRRVKDALDVCRVVVVSAYPELEEETLILGAHAFIKKPVVAGPLLEIFEDAVRAVTSSISKVENTYISASLIKSVGSRGFRQIPKCLK